MDMLMLTGIVIATIGGMLTLAFRVVRLPLGGQRARQTTNRAQPTTGQREPTQILLNHVTDEYKRHSMALREAQNLRRARNELEAMSQLLNERIKHAEAARKLGRFVQPTFGGRVRQWLDQTRLDVLADTVRREVEEVRLPATPTRPLNGERAFTRFVTWARGGPQTGAPQELVAYHRNQREHYRMAMVHARRFLREGRQADALTRLVAEQSHHLRVTRDLKRQFQPGDGPDGAGATDPALSAILN